MADYSSAASNAETALNTQATSGFVKSYSSSEGNSATLPDPMDQLKALQRLEGLSHRRTNGGFCNVGRPVNPFT